MKLLTTTAIILVATIGSAHASCGGEWSFYGDMKETDKDRDTYSRSSFNNTFDDQNEYRVGFEFKIPFGDDDCDYVRAKSVKERDLARKARANAEKAQAEAKYAANRAKKEEEFAISKRIDNLQRLVVTCETHDLAICEQIDELSLELFN